MSHSGGWIKLWRKLAENEMWLSEPFTKGQAWVDLLMMADRTGTIDTTTNELAERWQWSRWKVMRFLQQLQDCTMIRTPSRTGQRTPSRTSLIVVAWDKFQGQRTGERTSNRTGKRTGNRTSFIMKEEDDIEEDKKKNKESAVAALTPVGVVPPAFRDRFGDDYAAYRRWADQ